MLLGLLTVVVVVVVFLQSDYFKTSFEMSIKRVIICI